MSSIINRNIQKLGEKFLQDVRYVDFDYRGNKLEEDPENKDKLITTHPVVIHNGAVIVNDVKLWLLSTKGDYYRRPLMGGFFDDVRTKYTLDDIGTRNLSDDLREAISQQFPYLEIISLIVEPLIDRRAWKIILTARDTITGIMASMETGIDAEE
jgi:hypothetical protein